jgi:hypothetical protein
VQIAPPNKQALTEFIITKLCQIIGKGLSPLQSIIKGSKDFKYIFL